LNTSCSGGHVDLVLALSDAKNRDGEELLCRECFKRSDLKIVRGRGCSSVCHCDGIVSVHCKPSRRKPELIQPALGNVLYGDMPRGFYRGLGVYNSRQSVCSI